MTKLRADGRVLGTYVGSVCGAIVCAVNGNLVRTYFSDDFALGGHNRKWKWIPGAQIWIEVTGSVTGRVSIPDFAANTLHEALEYGRMRCKRETYAKAHDAVRRIEAPFRRELVTLDLHSRKQALMVVQKVVNVIWPNLDLS
jgi:hypothetical protein